MFLSRRSSVPLSIGLLRSVIVLPETMLRTLDEAQWQAVLLHETAHIARRDHWVGVGQRIAAMLFWWNPLVHWTCGKISELREEICDNHVVLVQGEGRRLAQILVDLAARVATGALLPSTVGVLEPRPAGLAGRVTRLLDKERNMDTRMNLRSKVFLFSCGLILLIGMTTVGGLRLARAEAATKSPPAAADQRQSEKDRASSSTPRVSDSKHLPTEAQNAVPVSGTVYQADGKPAAGAGMGRGGLRPPTASPFRRDRRQRSISLGVGAAVGSTCSMGSACAACRSGRRRQQCLRLHKKRLGFQTGRSRGDST